MDSPFRSTFPVLLLVLAAISGCSAKPATDPAATAALRSKLTLAADPKDVQTVSEVRTAMLGEAPPSVLALLEEDHDHDHGVEDHLESGADHDHADEKHAGPAAPTEHAPHEEAADHDHHEHETAATTTAAGESAKEMDVVMIGVVGGVPNPSEQAMAEFPFAKGKALFFLADPVAAAELEEHGHHHAPGEECAFCAAHAADAKALIAAVSFSDDHGKVLSVDSRDLFGLKTKDSVVVKGKARVAPGGILTVEATGLFVRK